MRFSDMFHCGLNVSGSRPWCRTNPPNVSYIDADGRVSGGSLWVVVDQKRSIRINCVQFRSITHNTDWLRISCSATAFRLQMLSRGGRLRFSLTFKKKTQLLYGSMRILTNSGRLWRMDIRFIADSYSQWKVLLNCVCVTPALVR